MSEETGEKDLALETNMLVLHQLLHALHTAKNFNKERILKANLID